MFMMFDELSEVVNDGVLLHGSFYADGARHLAVSAHQVGQANCKMRLNSLIGSKLDMHRSAVCGTSRGLHVVRVWTCVYNLRPWPSPQTNQLM